MAVKKTTAKKTTQKAVKKVPTKRKVKVSVKKTESTLHVAHMKESTTPQMSSYMTYMRNPRLWVGVAAVVIVVLLYLYKGLFVAALVNGEPVTRIAVINQLEKQNGKTALSNLVVESLIKQEAQRRHISVGQSEIDAQMKKINDSLKGQGVTLDDALNARGLSRQDLLDQIILQTLLNKMVGTTVKVTDDDVQAYIDKNQSSLPQGLSDTDLRNQVRQQLQQQQLQDKTQAFVADLQRKAKIQYFVSY